ncbi:hypothetical protein C7212DRAFT_222655 [Tuber magnatum]|uniref:Uncharacterized protein n=1 Tax=Tuber magnatum TaxID=42249 RepID=A0A317SEJ4_9PEZI|nr:hypothetical protein C7212DRAFT_222655 [Tuber magnatum]
MSLRPEGKQSSLCAGWYEIDRIRHVQDMVFPPEHERFPNMPCGLQSAKLQERKYSVFKEENICRVTATGCYARKIISRQPDFTQQKGRLQEGVERLDHIILFLSKFHYEINWIEYN